MVAVYLIGGTDECGDTGTHRWIVNTDATSIDIGEYCAASWGISHINFEVKNIELFIDSDWKRYLAQWVLREKPYTPKCKTKSIGRYKPEPARRILRCNRKGIGLRMRLATK